MLLHGIKFSNFKIENGDTLEADAFGETQFDAVVANPPFSAEWSASEEKFNNDDRFSKAGRLAPKKTADYAFILHMVYHLTDGGTMACVAPHGVLFRGNAEGVIRRFLIEKKNYIDAIIGLPANIFYGTSIPTCILVMKKCRKEGDNILFIDASKEFEKVKTQNKLRPEHIRKIIDTYRNRTEIEKKNKRKRLISECEINWSKYGYKKTNIDELCSKSGIAKGSFYTFFDSKEKLFFEVLNGIQNRLISSVDEILSNMPPKEGFAKALKMLYRLYDKNPFLYSPTNTDYITLLNKIPKEMLSQLEYSNVQSIFSFFLYVLLYLFSS